MLPTVTKSEEELERAITLEQEIAGELADIEKQLSEAESTGGTRSLEARKAGDQKAIQKINDGVLKLRNQHDVTSKTLQAARTAIIEARHEVNKTKARILREQAGELMEKARERQRKTDALLAELREHEGIWYQPEAQTRAGVYIAGTYAQTRTAGLAEEAIALVRQAEGYEREVCGVEPAPSTAGRKSGAIYPNDAGEYVT